MTSIASEASSGSAPIASVAGLRFEYPGVRALDDVSFALASGTVTALVGPNGAGKSTLLRCMAGLETPERGEISVAGIDVLEAPRQAHRRLGYLSDFFGVYEALTVRQCLMHAAAINGIGEAELAAAVERTASTSIAARPDVSSLVAEGALLAFSLRGEEGSQAAVLRALVDAGVAVVAFGESRENLHDSYLRTVAQPKP